MATNIVQMTDGSGNKQYPVTRAEAVGMPDGSGNLQNYLNKRVTELNISVLYPTQGIGGTNKYDLATAIAQVPAEYRTIQGLKVSFVNESGDTETWEYKGGSWAVANFAGVGTQKFSELDNQIDKSSSAIYAALKVGGFTPKILKENSFIKIDGTEIVYEGGVIFEPVLVNKINTPTILYTGQYGKQAACCVFFNAENEIIGYIDNPSLTVNAVEEEISIPDECVRAQFCSLTGTCIISAPNSNLKRIENIESELQSANLDGIDNAIKLLPRVYENVEISAQNNKYASKSGNKIVIADLSNFECAVITDIPSYGRVTLWARGSSNTITGVYYTDDNDTIIGSEISGTLDTSSKVENYDLTIPVGTKKIYLNNVIKSDGVTLTFEKGYNVEALGREEYNNDNPLHGKKMGVLGDSMATNTGTPSVFNTFIASRNNMTVDNQAVGGQYIANYGSLGKDVVDQVKLLSTDCDYVVLFGGTNDISRGTGIIPIGENDSSDDTTFKGALNYIFTYLLDNLPNAKVCCITPYHRYGRNDEGGYEDVPACLTYVDALKEMCEKYNIPVFDNTKNGGICWINDSQRQVMMGTEEYPYGDNLHLNLHGKEYVSYKYEAFLKSL